MENFKRFQLVLSTETGGWAVKIETILGGEGVSGETIPVNLTAGADDFSLLSVFKAILHDNGMPLKDMVDLQIHRDEVVACYVALPYTPGPKTAGQTTLPTFVPVPPKRTKLFFDLEFDGLFGNADLISLGIVSEGEESFYAEFNDFNRAQLRNVEFLNNFVFPNLLFENKGQYFARGTDKNFQMKGNRDVVRGALRRWLKQFPDAEFWGDVCGHDWVFLTDLFDNAIEFGNQNPNVSYIPMDLATAFYMRGIDPDIDRESYGFHGSKFVMRDRDSDKQLTKHNAFYDAHVQKCCLLRLESSSAYVGVDWGKGHDFVRFTRAAGVTE